MTVKLRTYQSNGRKELYSNIRSGIKKNLVVMPTGAGKTTFASAIIEQAVLADKRILIFVHSKELVRNFADRLFNQFRIKAGIIMSGYKEQRHLNIQVASIQTLVRRKLPPADVVFIDEAHRAKANSYKKVIEFYPDAALIGLTATPFRTDGKPLDMFDKIVHPIRIRELIKNGDLVPTEVWVPKKTVDLKGVRVRRDGEFDYEELSEIYSKKEIIDGVVDSYLKEAKGLKSICFNTDVKHSKLTCEVFNEAGISSAHIDGDTLKDERERIFEGFVNGEYDVLHSVGIFVEGIDIPEIQCVIWNSATNSFGKYVQGTGRGLRPVKLKDGSHRLNKDGTRYKTKCIVLDHGGNTLRHGFVEDYDLMPFSLDGGKVVSLNLQSKCKVCNVGINRFIGHDDEFRYFECTSCKHKSKRKRQVRSKVKISEADEELIMLKREAVMVNKIKKYAFDDFKIIEEDGVKKRNAPEGFFRIHCMLNGFTSQAIATMALQYGIIVLKEADKSGPNFYKKAFYQLSLLEDQAGVHDLYQSLKKQLSVPRKKKKVS